MSAATMLANRQVRRAPGRVLAVALAALLSAMAIMATGTFIETMQAGMRASIAAPISKADVVVQFGDDGVTQHEVAALPGVAVAEPSVSVGGEARVDGRRYDVELVGVPVAESLRWTEVSAGALPTSADEIALSSSSMALLKAGVGDTVSITPFPEGEPVTATVVGEVVVPDGAEGGRLLVYVHPATYATPGDAMLVQLDPGTTPDAFVADFAAAHPGEPGEVTQAKVASKYVDELIDQFTGGTNMLATMFLAFVAIALVAATMVIRNTFQVLLAQRLRETGLLRLVGASGAQVQRTVLTEALLVGSVGAIAGVITGVLLGWGIAIATRLAGGGLMLPWLWAVAAIVVTVAMTLIAAWAPARSARNLPPVAALAAAATTEEVSTRARRTGWIVGTILTVLGAAALTAAALMGQLLLAITAGLVLAAGLIVVVPHLVSAVMPFIARMLAGGGIVAKLAGENLVRTSRRSGTVVLAIALGGSLVLAMLTGVSSAAATLDDSFAQRYRVDAAVTTKDGSPLTPAQLERIAALPAVEASTPLETAEFGGEAAGVTISRVAAVPAEWADRGDRGLTDTTLLLPTTLFAPEGPLADDQLVTVMSAAGTTLQFTAVGDPLAHPNTPSEDAEIAVLGLVTPAALSALGAEATTTHVWLDVHNGQAQALVEQLTKLTTDDPSLSYGGGVNERAIFEQVTSMLTAFVLAMLALTVVISAIGLASVVALAVSERRRELALIRALGASRGEVRRMVFLEAIVLALVGAALSIIIGIPLGIAALYSMAAATEGLRVALPWAGIVGVVLGALLLGVASGFDPARRAAKVAPAAALARE